jgi:hypothetical protein
MEAGKMGSYKELLAPRTTKTATTMRRPRSARSYNSQPEAEALAARFFPNPPANLSDIFDTTFNQAFDQPRFEVRREVTTVRVQKSGAPHIS